MNRSSIFILFSLGGILFLGMMVGCSKHKPPINPMELENRKVIQNKGRLVGELAEPSNMTIAPIQGVALVEGLADTGADEPPSQLYQMVLADLQRDPEEKRTAKLQLASMSTAIVSLEAKVPPGARKGDRVDVTVKLPGASAATSLEGGYIRSARMQEYINADYLRKGTLAAFATGDVMLDPDLIERESPIAFKQGRMIGGVVVVRPREVWLTITHSEDRSAGIAQRLEDVINNRFSYRSNGYKKKVAEAKSGAARIDLVVPEEYRENINRYMNVVCHIAFFETPDELQRRLTDLKIKLHRPESAEFASLQMEAIGPNNPLVVETLRGGLASPLEEVRYHSAMAMAYLDVSTERGRTTQLLAQMARDNPKLRPSCLAVLGTCLKTSVDADAALRELLASSSVETRYGAFRALWTRNPADYMIRGENMNEEFSYHVLNCSGTPMVHATMSTRPEIVLFAKENLYLTGNFELEAGRRITVRNQGADVLVKHYKTGLDEQRITTNQLDGVIRGLVNVGATYPDIVRFLVAAKKSGALVAVEGGRSTAGTLAFDALPGSKMAAFRRIRDLDELEREERIISGIPEKKKTSVWSKANPARWFSRDKEGDDEDYSATFGDDPPPEETEAEWKSHSEKSEKEGVPTGVAMRPSSEQPQ